LSKKAQKMEIPRLFLVNNSHEKCHKIKFIIFYFPILPQLYTKMFESLRNEKKKEEISEGIVSEMTEEKSASDLVEAGAEPAQEPQNAQAPPQPASQTEIGIGNLKDKRVKLEEAVDYVGLLIANLKEKRTRLEKEVEEESVDIKNLRAKLAKVGEYIQEEGQSLQNLSSKRSVVEQQADEVCGIIDNLRGHLAKINQVVEEEGNVIKDFKNSREKSDNF